MRKLAVQVDLLACPRSQGSLVVASLVSFLASKSSGLITSHTPESHDEEAGSASKPSCTDYHKLQKSPVMAINKCQNDNVIHDIEKGDDQPIRFFRSTHLYWTLRNPSPLKALIQKNTREMFERRVTHGMLRRALQIYDLESYSLPPNVVSALEEIFNVKDIVWPTDGLREMMMGEKILYTVKCILLMYGSVTPQVTQLTCVLVILTGTHSYGDLSYYSENGKGRCRIMPRPGRSPPRLPKFLNIPFFVPTKGVKKEIVLQKGLNPSVINGDALYTEGRETPVGTLGIIMVSQQTHVALTAGHILADGDRTLRLRSPVDGEDLILTVAGCSIRFFGWPIGRRTEDIGFQDDCALLKIRPEDIHHFAHVIPRVNPHFHNSDHYDEADMADPVVARRMYHLQRELNVKSITVYKNGAGTDLIVGQLVKIDSKPPRGWYGRPTTDVFDGPEVLFENNSGTDSEDEGKENDAKMSENDDQDDDENDHEGHDNDDGDDIDEESNEGSFGDDEWMGYVRWTSPESPFSSPCDSGSLVYALEGNVTIPLGIHVGCPSSEPHHSVFICLETFCFEGDKEGWELQFSTT
jgi:hypothetical protein